MHQTLEWRTKVLGIMKASVVDRHRFDADPDPNIHLFLCRSRSESYPKFYHNFKYLGQHNTILSKKVKIHLLGIDTEIRIRIGIHWLLVSIRQNDADPTRSGSTTLTKALAPRMEGKAKTTS